jgi:hypothetical protein
MKFLSPQGGRIFTVGLSSDFNPAVLKRVRIKRAPTKVKVYFCKYFDRICNYGATITVPVHLIKLNADFRALSGNGDTPPSHAQGKGCAPPPLEGRATRMFEISCSRRGRRGKGGRRVELRLS